MASVRLKQVEELIRRNFGIVLQEEGNYIYGPEPLVTVTQVRISPDLGLAKIYLSVYNTENKQAVILQMEESQTRLRQSLAYRIKRHVRKIPQVDFYLDDTLDEMYRLGNLFGKLHQDDQMGEEDK
ncbi:MAG: 30S ribosome-binding factor RbfA [Saprospiraceae bacterium]